MLSVRNPKRPSTNWERSNSLNWRKFLQKYSARLAQSTGQKDCSSALSKHVYDIRKNRSARQMNNLKSCRFIVTL